MYIARHPCLVMVLSDETLFSVVTGENANLHLFKFRDGILILSDEKLERLALTLDIAEARMAETAAADALARFKSLRRLAYPVGGLFASPDPCAWNFFLKRRYCWMFCRRWG